VLLAAGAVELAVSNSGDRVLATGAEELEV
jgi:hypothetical protein